MQNNASNELPSVLPLDILQTSPRAIAYALNVHKDRLTAKFGNDITEKIDSQIQLMKTSFNEEEGFPNAINSYKDVQSFKSCWSPLGDQFNELKEYAGGITTVMLGTSSVEADFLLINWHKDLNSNALKDFSLESILHCGQYTRLTNLISSTKTHFAIGDSRRVTSETKRIKKILDAKYEKANLNKY